MREAKWVGELGSVARGSTSLSVDIWRRGWVHLERLHSSQKQFNQPQPMTYEREKNSGGWVLETEKQTVFCSISSTPGAASSSSFSSTSSKHWSLNLLLHPHTASFFVDLQSCTLYGILHEWYKRILIIATLRIYCLQRENVLQSCFFVMVCRVSLSFFYLWLKVLSVFLSLSSEWYSSLCTFTYAKNTSGPKVTWRLDIYCMYI